MNRETSIQLKAVFLMAVFALNTVVGLACSMGLGMGSKTSHHKKEATDPVLHIHADGKKHHHQKKPVKVSAHVHADGKKHEHKSEPVKQQQEENEKTKKEKDGCCSVVVLKFQNLDKNLNQNAKTAIGAPAFIALISIFSGVDILKTTASAQLPVIRYLFPPPPNILITIQRFQI